MGLRLSKEYGLNPSLLKCFLCGADIGVVLLGANDGKKASMTCVTGEICEECKKYIESGGGFIVAAKPDENGNPVPTGMSLKVLKEQIFSIFNTNKPIAFMEHEAFNKTFAHLIPKEDGESDRT